MPASISEHDLLEDELLAYHRMHDGEDEFDPNTGGPIEIVEEEDTGCLTKLVNRVGGWPLMCCGIVGYASQGSIYTKLIELGEQNLLPNGENPISSCAVLCVGGIAGAMTFGTVFKAQFKEIGKLDKNQWAGLVVCTILYSVIAQYLSFEAFAQADSVITVILIGRMEPVLTLLLTRVLFKEAVSQDSYISAAITATGILLAIVFVPLFETGSVDFSFSTLLSVGSALAFSLNNTLSRKVIANVPVGIFLTFRSLVGAFFFFWLAVALFGFDHFAYTFAPFILFWMILYAGGLQVAANAFWWTGLKTTTPARISLIGSSYFILGVVFAYLIVGTLPSAAEYVGSAFIVASIIYSQVAATKLRRRKAAMAAIKESSEYVPDLAESSTFYTESEAKLKLVLDEHWFQDKGNTYTVRNLADRLDEAGVVEYPLY